jgi:multicomponent K+:H+ antiporter subunit E
VLASPARRPPRDRAPRRWLPQPLLSVLLLAGWVLAFNRISAGVLVSGLIVALAIPYGAARYWPEYPVHVRAGPALRLGGVLLWDILVANVRVAALVLGPRARLRPAFFVVPLDAEHPFVVALLAAAISLTPGTVSADYDPGAHALLVHALDAADPDAEVAHIKARYERALREVFE